VADDNSFLGTGWSFPPTFADQGRSVRMISAEEDIRQSLGVLLATGLGERVLRPTFGWQRDALLFEPLSTSFGTLVKREIATAVLYFEPRVELNLVTFETPTNLADTSGRVDIRLDYTIRATNSRSNLVYPFYLDEASLP